MNQHDPSSGRTLLHLAASTGRVAAIESLIKAGANINATDNDLNTPLHLAVLHSHLDVVESLIKAGADVNAVNKDLNTPFQRKGVQKQYNS